jgi:PKD repeat protein
VQTRAGQAFCKLQDVSHTYPKLGTFDFQLTVRDTSSGSITGQSIGSQRLSAQALDTRPIVYQKRGWHTIWRKAPVASFTIDTPASRLNPSSFIAAGNYPFTATFNATSSSDSNLPSASVLTYDWNFGDGTPIVVNGGPNPSHMYAKEGRFLVTLTVKNSFGLSSTYNNFVYSHDIRANIKLNMAYEAVGVQPPPAALSVISEPNPLIKTQGIVDSVTDYYPYVLHKSYSFKGGSGSILDRSGNKIQDSFCASLEAYANGGPSLFSTKANSPGDPSGQFCTGLILGVNAFKFPARTLNELLITNDRYLNSATASVFASLVVPHVSIAILPDGFIPGEQVSPLVTESKYVNPATSKTEWLMLVRFRESEMKSSFASGAQLSFKIPVLAVDDNGKFMTTINGRFKAAFSTSDFLSDCGECAMINGRSYINITIPVNQYTKLQSTLDLSTIALGTDTSTKCGLDNISNTFVKYGLNGCVLVGTSSVYPTASAPVISDYTYPIGDPTKFFGHIVFGETADKVRKFEDGVNGGFFNDAVDGLKETLINQIPFYGSGKQFSQALDNYRQQGPSVGSVANVFLAGLGVAADFVGAGEAAGPYWKILVASRLEAKGAAKAFDEVIADAAAAGKLPEGIHADMEANFGTIASAVKSCGDTCAREAAQAIDGSIKRGLSARDSMKELEQGAKDATADGQSLICFLEATSNGTAYESVAEINQYILGVFESSIHTLNLRALAGVGNKCTYKTFNGKIQAGRAGKYPGVPQNELSKAAPHHIVPLNALAICGRASGINDCDKMRDILKRAGIDINDADNGVLLAQQKGQLPAFDVAHPNAIPHKATPGIHSKIYVSNVYDRLAAVELRRVTGITTPTQFSAEVKSALDNIADELLAGTFPIQ